ncbi:MAG: hypothetical protein ACJ71Z_03050 [Aeromicrobium sp.]
MRRAATSVFAAVLACLTLSACGGSGESLPTFKDAAKGEKVAPESFLSALRSSFRSGSTAVVSFDVRGGAALRGGGAVRYADRTMDSDLRIEDWQVSGGSIDVRTIGGRTYMRVPESRGLWVNLSAGHAGTPGADLADEADPRKAIKELRATIQEVRFSGTERLSGVPARRYQVVTKPKAKPSAGATPASSRPVVTEYWFNRDGRVVRRQSEVNDTGSVIFRWSDWGKPVKIARPAPHTVVTLKHLELLRKKQAAEHAGESTGQ